MAPRKSGRSASQEKAVQRAELKGIRTVTITLEATEETLQRIAALLLFAPHLEPVYTYEDKPLPWEDPNDPRYQKPPELEIDYHMVRREIMKLLESLVKSRGEERARAVLAELLANAGASRLSSCPEAQLLPLHDALKSALESE
jgi:hypothetical protein